MQISPEDLEEFKKLYAAEYGEELSQAEASEMAGRLVSLYSLLSQPLPSELKERQKKAKQQQEERGSPSPS